MNTTVIITLIICATIISLVAIICDHCTEKKMTNANADCTLSKKIIRLHRNYIAGMLSFAIIMLFTSQVSLYGLPFLSSTDVYNSYPQYTICKI